MPIATAFTLIDTPVYRVRRWLFATPYRASLWWPQIVRTAPAPPGTPTPPGAVAFQYVYDLLGMHVRGLFVVHAAADGVLIRTLSGLEAELRFALAAAGSMTSVGVRVDYHLPGALLGGTLNPRTAEQASAEALVNALLHLKALLEKAD